MHQSRLLLLVLAIGGSWALERPLLRWACGPVARTLAEQLAWLGPFSMDAPPSPPESEAVTAAADPEPEPAPANEPESPADTPAEPAARPRRSVLPASRTPARAAPQAIDVPADLVQRAVPPPNRPSGVLVAATSTHPAGIEIRSAGALRGIVQPGDIVAEAEGQSVTTWQTLIGIVTRAYGRHVEAVHGRIWRKGDWIGVSVHIPYTTAAEPRQPPATRAAPMRTR